MRYIKWTLILTILTLVVSVLHYTLPQTDIVRVVATDTRRIDFGENQFFWATPDVGTGAGINRDVKFIEAVRPNGRVIVYRNEDTGWGWPPYFKLNSFNLQAEASNLISTQAAPRWVAVKHYGWRNEFFTIFPNAISLREVEGPDVRIVPWVNLVVIATLIFLVFMVWKMLAQFRERVIDPAADRVTQTLDDIDSRRRSLRQRIADWLGTWRGKPRR
ncbi:MAG TPA: DUF1523 family protein [Paracoccaceae bacterium]|nr:DUF1523 family protein [Paracoccaceae bacterium]HMO71064.1 DUF1523 family protein [Paracoccaceae bacterium]